MIPNKIHFVFGLDEQPEPFHFAHYLSVESARRVLAPEVIYFHHKHLPWGPWWDRIRPALTLVEVDLVEAVTAADYSGGDAARQYRYAHHADFIRLDALIEHGGIYADIDTIFVRPFPGELFEHPFVIGREMAVRDERSGELRASLCNALLMAEPGALFARAWRERMAAALNGTWSNHSGFLSQELSDQLPEAVHIEPEERFFAFECSQAGLSQLLEERLPIPPSTVSVHLWAHLWWDRNRRDFSLANAAWCTPAALRRARTTLADLARPYLGEHESPWHTRSPAGASGGWLYLSLDETSGYAIAGERCRAALENSGVEIDWTPFIRGGAWGAAYAPPPCLDPFEAADAPLPSGQVVVAHLVPEYLPKVRERAPDAFVVGHVAWETDRIPDHWVGCAAAADLLVVPSEFSAKAFSSSPISTPVAVVPHVAPSLRSPPSRLWDGIPREVFVFYTVAEWNERKAVFKTIEAYLRAFTRRDPVLMVVKTSRLDGRVPRSPSPSAVGPGTTAWALATMLARHSDPPAISLMTGELADDDLHALHIRGDCFVSLCRSEGWGLGAFDAAAYGNPVVTTGHGGHLEYLPDSAYLVDFELVAVEDPAGFPSYAPEQRWADPDVDHGAALLRDVLANREDAAAMAASLAEDLRWRYREQAVAAAFVSAVDSTREVARGGEAVEPRSRGRS